MTKLLLINGAPRSGKDTAGEIAQHIGRGKVHVAKFAKVLKERTHALYGLVSEGRVGKGTPDYELERGSPWRHGTFEAVKDQPRAEFFGITPRQAYIAVSEKLMKPLHGEAVFGRLLLEDLKRNAAGADLIVVTDSGFAAEAAPLVEHFGRENTILMRVHRPGCTFAGDSRSHIELPGVRTVEVHNASTLELFAAAVSYTLVDLGLATTKGEERARKAEAPAPDRAPQPTPAPLLQHPALAARSVSPRPWSAITLRGAPALADDSGQPVASFARTRDRDHVLEVVNGDAARAGSAIVDRIHELAQLARSSSKERHHGEGNQAGSAPQT